MPFDKSKPPRRKLKENTVPFESVSESWFWFVLAQQARNEGARFTAGMSLTPRPCEPTDILKVLDGLYRQRRLMRDHLLVLRHYGRRQMAPDPKRSKEILADKLWREALERIEPILIRKGIVKVKTQSLFTPSASWAKEATLYQNENGLR